MSKRTITRQGIFNKVYVSLVRQGEPAYDHGAGACEYRLDRDGKTLCCAAGWLLSDQEAQCVKDQSWMTAYKHYRTPSRFNLHADFIQELQKIHDRWESLTHFKNEMASFAALHELKVPDV